MIQDFLNLRILRGIDLQAAAVQRIERLGLGIPRLLYQILAHLVGHFIHKIGIDCTGGFRFFVVLPDPGIHIIRHGILIFFLRDIALLQHILKHQGTPVRIILRVADGIISTGTFGDGRQHRRLRQGQFTDILSEIPVGRCLNP